MNPIENLKDLIIYQSQNNENIQQFPYIGADLSKRVSFKTDYKYVVWQDYVVLYKVVKETVEIYRVVNRYQDITRIF